MMTAIQVSCRTSLAESSVVTNDRASRCIPADQASSTSAYALSSPMVSRCTSSASSGNLGPHHPVGLSPTAGRCSVNASVDGAQKPSDHQRLLSRGVKVQFVVMHEGTANEHERDRWPGGRPWAGPMIGGRDRVGHHPLAGRASVEGRVVGPVSVGRS